MSGMDRLTDEALVDNIMALKGYQGDDFGDDLVSRLEVLSILSRRASQAAPAPSEPVTLTYTNWQGKTAQRAITPVRVWFGSTPWHPEPQWLLTAVDVEKGLERDFALKDFGAPAPSDGLREAAARRILDDAISSAEDDMRADLEDAEDTGEHVDVGQYEIVLSYETAQTIRAALTPAPAQQGGRINWRNDPDAIVEDDEPQTGRDYA